MTVRPAIHTKGNLNTYPAIHLFPPRTGAGAAAPCTPARYLSFPYTDWWGAALPYTPSNLFTLSFTPDP